MNLPAELKYTKAHTWLKIEGTTAKIGITEYAAEQLGDIVFVDLPETDSALTAGETFTEIESSKTAVEVPAPVSGTVTAVNEALDDEPESINDDAYAAWIVEVELDGEAEGLLDAAAYAALCQ